MSSLFSVEDGSAVRTYLDCHWITTQILHRHSLNVPDNADLIIGYMFQVRSLALSLSLSLSLSVSLSLPYSLASRLVLAKKFPLSLTCCANRKCCPEICFFFRNNGKRGSRDLASTS